MWLCRCDCGIEREVDASNLRAGTTKSCGCILAERNAASIANKKKRIYKPQSVEYVTWKRMRSRCFNHNSPDFKDYGGRGITICDRWSVFANFLADMGKKPSPSHSIDRYPDNDGNYEPGNCRWATPVEQARNKRTTRWIEYQGQLMSTAEACERAGLEHDLVLDRLNVLGWSEYDAINTPKLSQGQH
jgi:hypothetical protein